MTAIAWGRALERLWETMYVMFAVLSPRVALSYVDGRSCRFVAMWLLACCFLVACMVVLGGYTRLSGSGLSMPSWQPIMGILPPLSADDWLAHYRAYQATPEYRLMMSDLASFKVIFWIEYSHRLLGRVLGLVFFLPLLFFAWQRYVTREWLVLFSVLFILGALQGLMGWLMVYSGLVDEPQVSPYRLAAHLFLAFLLYGLLFSAMLRWMFPHGIQGEPTPSYPPHPYYTRDTLLTHIYVAFVLFAVTVIFGALVAGNHAGLIYNTYPLMDGSLLPPLDDGRGAWYQQMVTVPGPIQWVHRLLSFLTVLVLFALVYRIEKNRSTPPVIVWSARSLFLVLISQFSLGIATLLYGVPTLLALSHQFGALLLLSMMVWLMFAIKDYQHSFLASLPPPIDNPAQESSSTGRF
ncbi:MAG: COX15/CtaA family protein [Alphaproteobacteria bacterium GM202ARS2]|nr:COX15/CtaA family protein [Alphaproteobacteria bacterium GM202ARS2]